MNRQAVYNKYSGRCAYCGREIEYKGMQVDHMVPKASGGTDDIENLMPACRLCNHYKRANSLEWFRHSIETIPFKLARDMYTYRVGMAYGFYSNAEKEILFHFELQEIKELLGPAYNLREWRELKEQAAAVMRGISFIKGEDFYDTDDYQFLFDQADLKAGWIRIVRIGSTGFPKSFKLTVDVPHLSVLRIEEYKGKE